MTHKPPETEERMTAPGRMLKLPPSVQILIKAHMFKFSLGDPNPDLDAYCARALEWWDGVRGKMSSVGMDEETAASKLIDRLGTHTVWGRILRGQAN